MMKPFASYFLLRHRDFGLFWVGMLLAGVGSQIQSVTIGWQIYTLARATLTIKESAFLVGMIGLVQFLPLFALSLFAGSVADRYSRRWILLITLTVELICLIALAFTARSAAHGMTPIFVVAGIFGASRAFLAPANWAVTPMLVPKAEMPQAISLKFLSGELGVISGPLLGGLLCAVSIPLSFSVAAALYAVGILVMLLIRTNTTPERQPGSPLQQIREGLIYVWQNKIIFGAISLDLFAVLLGGATALLPAFASDILHVGPTGFGILRMSPAIGALAMALVMARWPLKRHAGPRMFWAVAVFGAATIVFGLSRSMWVSMLALATLGAADMISMYVRQTLVQIVTPDPMRGRVSSVSGLFIAGSNELGEFESGVVSRFLGPVGAAVFGGIGTLIVTGAWAKMFPDLRRADRLDAGDDVQAGIPDGVQYGVRSS